MLADRFTLNSLCSCVLDAFGTSDFFESYFNALGLVFGCFVHHLERGKKRILIGFGRLAKLSEESFLKRLLGSLRENILIFKDCCLKS